MAWVAKRGLGRRGRRYAVPAVRVREMVPTTEFIVPDAQQSFQDGVAFLNNFQAFDQGRVDWLSAGSPKLWRYNLHYFDYLHWPDVSVQRKAALLDSWIAENPPGSEDAWEPYTASLRIVNWVKYFSGVENLSALPAHWIESLALQTAWLETNLEIEILANHYLKNAKTLVFAGAFFEGSDAQDWLQQGSRIFAEQIEEQFLPSGAHYELSPMYHAICTEDLLDVLNIVRSHSDLFSPSFHSLVLAKARQSLDFLAALLMPDGRIPLFNDSAFGIAPEPDQLIAYGARLFGYQEPPSSKREFCDAGYFVLGDESDRMVIDCGPVSPSYQPGHTHCDMLSFELALNGRRVVVDAGVYDYENSEERRYSRSTRAHNTISVDGEDQSELWGVFRVARRAEVIRAERERSADGRERFEGEITGFPRVSKHIRHRRSVDYESPGVWRVTDRVSGQGAHRVDSFVHLHPDLRVELNDDRVTIEDAAGQRIATVKVEPGAGIEVEQGWYFPEFGIKQSNQLLCLSATVALPMTLAYRIEKA